MSGESGTLPVPLRFFEESDPVTAKSRRKLGIPTGHGDRSETGV
jgi:hypothetical protein